METGVTLVPRIVPENASLIEWCPDMNHIWLTVRPRRSARMMRYDQLWTQPPREIQFGDTLPDDVTLCVDGHAITLGELRVLLRER
jgi:hypothetical protein